MRALRLVSFLSLLALYMIFAEVDAASDPFEDVGDSATAVVGPLATATLVTDDAELARRFFADGMQMQLDGARSLDSAELALRNRLLGLATGTQWRRMRFDRPALPGTVAVEVLVLSSQDVGGEVRPSMDARLQGGLSLGFPVLDAGARAVMLERSGFGSTAGVVPLMLPRESGQSYSVDEIHFKGPENLYALGVRRPDDMRPVGPLDAALGIGGPAYSGMVVSNADLEVEFYRTLLGWQVRRDLTLTSGGTTGGLGLPDGTRYRFLQLFAPGARTGYLVMLDMLDSSRANALPPRPPQQGLVMWSFGTRQFDRVVATAIRERVTIIGGPLQLPARDGRSGRSLSVLSPSGLLLEIFEADGS